MTRPAQRVIVYIDGFNLYYGLRAKGWRRYCWLDLSRLSMNLVRSGQTLVGVRYFTARVAPLTRDPDKQFRQATYLEALETLPDFSIHFGYYQTKKRTCHQCGAKWKTYEEKMTDVNIAVELLADAQDDAFDTAIVMSGDGDLSSPVRSVRERYPGKRVVIAFPPARHSAGLRLEANAYFTVGRNALRDSLFPDQIIKENGVVLTRPLSWK